MRKDIKVPKVSGVFMAVIHEYNDIYRTYDWNAYIINENESDLELVLILTEGYSGETRTSTLRKKIDVLPAKGYAKIEMIPEELHQLNNQFKVTFYQGNQLYDKTYLFRKNTINERALQQVPLINKKGVVVR